jgi:hypothetical protein
VINGSGAKFQVVIPTQLSWRGAETGPEIADLDWAGTLHSATPFVQIRLTKALAERLNGYHLRAYRAGEVVDLPDGIAMMLVAESWAEPIADQGDARDTCDDRPRRRRAG